jgi:hypothetical protein
MEINGERYVKESEVNNESQGNVYAQEHEGMKYVIVRADRAGVFAGYLKKQEGDTVQLIQCRRLWYWEGAASISQIAIDGVSKPSECKFPAEVNAEIRGVIEILDATEKARLSIKDVPIWQA